MNQLNKIKPYRFKKGCQGFTLIETLVAGFIMFLVLAAAVSVYRGAVISTIKASATLKGLNMVNEITPLIKQQILSNQQQDSLEATGFAGGVEYFWQAQVVKKSTGPQTFDADQGQFVTPTKIYKLWAVSLTVPVGKSTRTIEYNELSWP